MLPILPPPGPRRDASVAEHLLPPERPPSRRVKWIAVIIAGVLVSLALLAAILVLTSPLGPGDCFFIIHVRPEGSNSSVEIAHVCREMLPTSTYLWIRDPEGGIALAATPFSNLTDANWGTNRALYIDADPDEAGIRPGDSVLVERLAYPSGSWVAVADLAGSYDMGALQ